MFAQFLTGMGIFFINDLEYHHLFFHSFFSVERFRMGYCFHCEGMTQKLSSLHIYYRNWMDQSFWIFFETDQLIQANESEIPLLHEFNGVVEDSGTTLEVSMYFSWINFWYSTTHVLEFFFLSNMFRRSVGCCMLQWRVLGRNCSFCMLLWIQTGRLGLVLKDNSCFSHLDFDWWLILLVTATFTFP